MRNSHSLHYKINLSIIVTFLGIATLFSGVLAYVEIQRRDNAIAKIEVTLNDIFTQHRENLANEIFAEHERAIQSTFAQIMKREGIVSVTIYNDEGKTMVSTQTEPPPALSIPEDELENYALEPVVEQTSLNGEKVLSYLANVHAFGEFVGFFNVEYSMSALDRETMYTVMAFVGFLLTTLFIMALILNKMLSKLVLNPVYVLRSVMDRVKVVDSEEERFSLKDTINMRAMPETLAQMSRDLGELKQTRDEIGSLARSFDTMLGKLRGAYTDLKAAENKYRDIFENAVEGIFQLSTDKSVLSANKAMASLFGWDTPPRFIAGVKDMGADLCSDPDEMRSFLDAVEDMGSVSGVEMEFIRKDETRFWGSIAARVVRGDGGKILYYEGTLVDYTERLEKERAQSEREAAQAAAKARSVFLDNSGQGFLSFGQDLLVDNEYSKECEKIFGRKPGGMHIASLLFADDPEAGAIFAKSVLRTMTAEDYFKRELFLSLLQNEFQLEGICLEAEYKLVESGQMMLIFTDVTKRRELEQEVQTERRRLKFVVSAVREAHDFFEILDDFNEFVTEWGDGGTAIVYTGDSDPASALRKIYRDVHTFKGLFSQQDFIYLPLMLHRLEDRLSRFRTENRQASMICRTSWPLGLLWIP